MQRIGIRDGDRWILLPWFVLWLAVGAGAARAAEPYQAAAELRAQYAADIERLAQWCDSCGLTEQAGQTRAAVTPQEAGKIFLPVLPVEIGPPKLPPGSPQRLVSWDKRLWDLRKQQATKLYQMARQAIRSRREGLAFDLMLDAIQADPDYAPVRQVLGYQKFRNEWRTLYEVKKLHCGDGFQRQVRLDVEAKPCQVRGRAAALARPLDFGRRRRPGTPRHGLGLEHRDGALR